MFQLNNRPLKAVCLFCSELLTQTREILPGTSVPTFLSQSCKHLLDHSFS